MKIKNIASGSKGNCTIVLCDDTNLIIDMGISYLSLKKSLEENSLLFIIF
jgi:phosphoribosyl 1,2-cyclic phosphodiesterase